MRIPITIYKKSALANFYSISGTLCAFIGAGCIYSGYIVYGIIFLLFTFKTTYDEAGDIYEYNGNGIRRKVSDYMLAN